MRPSARAANELRKIKIERQFTKYAEGSVLVSYGATQVLCTVSVVSGVPRFLKGKNQGWLTAEYGMLPRSTHERMNREAVHGKQSGRTQEIQRLIGRALRSAVDLKAIGENTLTVDCDVLQADGGTRTASITGACVAIFDALRWMEKRRMLKSNPLKGLVAGVSVGIYQGVPVLDLDYTEDSKAHTDLNLVINEDGKIIEIQGTAESEPFSNKDLQDMLDLGEYGARRIIQLQREILTAVE